MSICEELTNSGIIQKVCQNTRYFVSKTRCTGFSTFSKYHAAPTMHSRWKTTRIQNHQFRFKLAGREDVWLDRFSWDDNSPKSLLAFPCLGSVCCLETKPSTFYSQRTALAHGGLGWPRLEMFSACMYLPVALLNSESKFGGTLGKK